MTKQTRVHSIIENRKALFDYEIIEEFEAGIELFWSEVKSIRSGQANLKWSYITLHTGVPTIVWMHVSEYKYTTGIKIDPKRERRILLKGKEIERLSQKVKEMGATIVPIEIIFRWNLIKLRIALARGKKRWEKKQVLKERDLDREVSRSFKW
jgi:SsrA-binding protein